MKSSIVLLAIVFSANIFASENFQTGAKYINSKNGKSLSFSCANNGCTILDAIEKSKDGNETLLVTINAEHLGKLSDNFKKRVEHYIKYFKEYKMWSITRGVAESELGVNSEWLIVNGTMMIGGMALDCAKMLPQQAYYTARLSRLDNDAKVVFSNLTNSELSKKEIKADEILYRELKGVLIDGYPSQY